MTQFLPYVTEHAILASAGCFVFVSLVFSFYLISRHLTHFTLPHIQSKITGILYMVPIYALDSFMGLLWPSKAVYINMLRDCYEVSSCSRFIFFFFIAEIILSLLCVLISPMCSIFSCRSCYRI
jgi:hypothetical protein